MEKKNHREQAGGWRREVGGWRREEGGGRLEVTESISSTSRVTPPPDTSRLTSHASRLSPHASSYKAGHMYLRAMAYKKLSMEELGRKSVAEFRTAEKSPVVVVLDNVRSMHNVGSVFRSADAFLVRGIYLCGYTPRPPHRDIHKTALGATETVHWEYEPEITSLVNRLKSEGFTICAVEQAEGSIPLQELDMNADQKVALVFGNEVDGVQDKVMALCDICIEIPQSGMKHSLNISVAAGIVLWEITRKTAHF